jgi:hypothetical protein
MAADIQTPELVSTIWAEAHQFSIHVDAIVKLARSAPASPGFTHYFLTEVGRTYVLLVTLLWVPLGEAAPPLVPAELTEHIASGEESLHRAALRGAPELRGIEGIVAQSLATGERDAARWSDAP